MYYRHRRRLLHLFDAIALTGLIVCTVFIVNACNAENLIGELVDGYCSTLYEDERAALRERIAAKVAPHRIVIQCGEQ